jgi:hypothetical protein
LMANARNRADFAKPVTLPRTGLGFFRVVTPGVNHDRVRQRPTRHVRNCLKPLGTLDRNGLALGTALEVVECHQSRTAVRKLKPVGKQDGCLLPRQVRHERALERQRPEFAAGHVATRATLNRPALSIARASARWAATARFVRDWPAGDEATAPLPPMNLACLDPYTQ